MGLPGSGRSAPVTRAQSQRKPVVRVRSPITLRGAPGDVRAEQGGSTTLGVGRGGTARTPGQTGKVAAGSTAAD